MEKDLLKEFARAAWHASILELEYWDSRDSVPHNADFEKWYNKFMPISNLELPYSAEVMLEYAVHQELSRPV